MTSDRFGINMKQFCREHEAKVTAAVETGKATEELLEEHLRMIAWVQHERLVHLIVTVMVVLCELFTVDLVLLHPELGIAPALIMLGLAVLLGVLLLSLLLPGEHRPAVLPDCGGDVERMKTVSRKILPIPASSGRIKV